LRAIALLLIADPITSDAEVYRQAGIDLARTGTMQANYRMPLYPLWTFITGGGVGLKVADIGLSLVTVWLIHELALEIFHDRTTAFVAASVAAIYPAFLYFPLLGITETAYACVLCAAFLALYRERYVAGSILLFYVWFEAEGANDRVVAAAFYIWVSTFNILIISVFWTFMADIFSRDLLGRKPHLATNQ